MKKIAILVIAAINQSLYIHYIRTYLTALISYLKVERSHIDVFLLFERETNINEYKNIEDSVIVDVNDDFDLLCDPEYCSIMIPGVLSKTIYALELLHDKYDVFFRTNLGSLIKVSAFDGFVQAKKSICYSGGWVWADGLRKDLLYYDKIGPNKSIKTLSELDNYEGNTFISGSGYLLNSEEAESLVRRKEEIRYDIIDDVSVGLMFPEYEQLPDFSTRITPDISVDQIMDVIRKTKACHIRLEGFPLDLAEALWDQLSHEMIWR